MITIIGSITCGRCQIAKNVLTSKGIDYEYKNFEDLTAEEQKKITDLNLTQLPIIYDGDKLLTLQEVAQL